MDAYYRFYHDTLIEKFNAVRGSLNWNLYARVSFVCKPNLFTACCGLSDPLSVE